jgi:hypothetical protein
LTVLNAPSGVKVKAVVNGQEVEKSYSPVSPPASAEHLDLLVKAYPPHADGT